VGRNAELTAAYLEEVIHLRTLAMKGVVVEGRDLESQDMVLEAFPDAGNVGFGHRASGRRCEQWQWAADRNWGGSGW
jgi:hypothetical protein